MQLPLDLQDKIIEILKSNKRFDLKNTQKDLTFKYKNKSGQGNSLINSNEDSVVYAISRMPATFGVILTLLNQLKEQGFFDEIKSVFDVGSGTGAGFFAAQNFDENIEISLFERDENMINMFNSLNENKKVNKFDLIKDNFSSKADLVMSCYVLSELDDKNRLLVADKLLNASNKYLLMIDTGTPEVFEKMMKIKTHLEGCGAVVVAPCRSKKCELKNDYCQFFARIERTSLHRMIKDAKLPYEDEKYFYLLFSKEQTTNKDNKSRVIRRPIISQNMVELVLCSENGVEKKVYTKKQKEDYKIAKKTKINELI